KKMNKDNQAFSAEQAKLENQYAKEQSKFDAELQDYYTQKNRASRQRGLDEFRKFNTLQDFAPGYVDTSQRIAVPNMPSPTGTTASPTTPKTTPNIPLLPLKD